MVYNISDLGLRVFRTEIQLTIYRVFDITQKLCGPHGVFEPAAIGTLDQKMYETEEKGYRQVQRRFVTVKVRI